LEFQKSVNLSDPGSNLHFSSMIPRRHL